MLVDIFTQSEFEAALPIHKETGQALWQYVGLVQGEHIYRIPVNTDISIIVRSSVDESGLSASTGQDSIRAWLIDSEGKPLGSKVSKWTTRLPGWQDRMATVLRELWSMARKSGYCPKCKMPNGVYRAKKGKPENAGRLFRKCRKCGGGFEWLT